MNRLVLSARLVERGALRYTPAGVPALDLSLQHESEVSEDGHPRKVSLEIRALAIGAITQPLSALALGSDADAGVARLAGCDPRQLHGEQSLTWW